MKYYVAQTTNKSFIQMRDKLVSENNPEPDIVLKVYDKDLIDFSMDSYLTIINMPDKDVASKGFELLNRKIHDECKKNIWFFFREIVRVPAFNDEMQSFTLSDMSYRMLLAHDNNYSFFEMSAKRLTGKTTFLACYNIYIEYLTHMGLYSKNNKIPVGGNIRWYTYNSSRRITYDTENIFNKIDKWLCSNNLPCARPFIIGTRIRTHSVMESLTSLEEMNSESPVYKLIQSGQDVFICIEYFPSGLKFETLNKILDLINHNNVHLYMIRDTSIGDCNDRYDRIFEKIIKMHHENKEGYNGIYSDEKHNLLIHHSR